MNFRRIYKNKVALCDGKCILVAGNRSLAVKKIQKLNMLVPLRTKRYIRLIILDFNGKFTVAVRNILVNWKIVHKVTLKSKLC